MDPPKAKQGPTLKEQAVFSTIDPLFYPWRPRDESAGEQAMEAAMAAKRDQETRPMPVIYYRCRRRLPDTFREDGEKEWVHGHH